MFVVYILKYSMKNVLLFAYIRVYIYNVNNNNERTCPTFLHRAAFGKGKRPMAIGAWRTHFLIRPLATVVISSCQRIDKWFGAVTRNQFVI